MMGKTNSLLTTVLAALLFTGCSQNEIMQTSPDAAPAVGFSVYATAQTRGTITDNTTTGTGIKNGTGFGVLAYHTGQTVWTSAASSTSPNFMYNQQVKYNGSKTAWEYTPVKYWPNTEGDKISFFAYAPYESSPTNGSSKGVTLSANSAKGAPTLKFTLKAVATDLIDLVATNANNGTHTTGTNQVMDITKRTAAVAFKFDHVLTRLNFKARLDASPTSETHIFVTGMRLLGSTNDNGSKLYSSATYKFADGAWDYATATAVQTNDYAVNGIMPLVDQTGVVSGYGTSGIKISSTTTGDNLLKTTSPSEYLFLIPVNNTTGLGSGQVKVQIDYDIVTKDGNLVGGFSKSSTKATVSLPEGTMARGKAYDYLFTIGLEKVQISADVTGWGTEEDVYIPSVKATSNSQTHIEAAITAMNTAKGTNPHCDYFVVNVPGTMPSSNITWGGITSNFKIGDKIELIFTGSGSATYGMANWTAVKSGNSIILTKNS